MQNYYKKQVEIAREFGISEGTITNWIKGAKEGRNKLQIQEINGGFYILKTEHNKIEIQSLAEKGRKFRNDESEEDLVVDDKLYEIMTENQVISLINSLKIRKTIPFKFVFLGEGGIIWDKFYKHVYSSANYGHSSRDYLIKKSFTYLNEYFNDFDAINIVDVGPGNFTPVKEIINYLIDIKKFRKYIALDISSEILRIAKENFYDNFKDLSRYSDSVIDIEINSLQDYLYQYKDYTGNSKILNLIIFVGGSIGMLEPQIKLLQNIKEGMWPEDILIVDNAYDIITNRTLFPAFESLAGDEHALYISKLIGIHYDLFSKEFTYNEKTEMREYNLVLNKNLNIHFKKFNTVVELKKYDKINVWKHRRDTFEFISEKIKQAGMELQFVAKHPTNPDIIYMVRAS